MRAWGPSRGSEENNRNQALHMSHGSGEAVCMATSKYRQTKSELASPARYAGTCLSCRKPFEAGAMVGYLTVNKEKKPLHGACLRALLSDEMKLMGNEDFEAGRGY